ncbi:hypothetical protein [Marinicella litoralis]|nr:hypothetical protein [Marinicella litoralis]
MSGMKTLDNNCALYILMAQNSPAWLTLRVFLAVSIGPVLSLYCMD